MRYLLFIIIAFPSLTIHGQEIIDGSFLMDDVSKDYALYIPSSYDQNSEQALIIGFHPLNPNRWDAAAWRDTLIHFAETNQLILACPDGGADGRIDDTIDTIFTSQLIDSLHQWYNIDHENQYAIGFSWGARTAYTYSLNHPGVFKGVIPIGAAIEGTNQFIDVVSNASLMNFYIVHGSNDSPNLRYFPVVNTFDKMEVCYETAFLEGVGHTIDFPRRNEILSVAYAFVSYDFSCSVGSSAENVIHSDITVFPNPIENKTVHLANTEYYQIGGIEIFDLSGKLIYQGNESTIFLGTKHTPSGVYILKIEHSDGKFEFRKLVFEN